MSISACSDEGRERKISAEVERGINQQNAGVNFSQAILHISISARSHVSAAVM
jgi:hypothetical protein